MNNIVSTRIISEELEAYGGNRRLGLKDDLLNSINVKVGVDNRKKVT